MRAMDMPSVEDIESKKAEMTAKLTAGGKNAEMMEWYAEYKRLDAELVAAKAARVEAASNSAAQNPT